jgi:carotenoid cleavage dioxygenase-like enzyme
MTPCGATQGFTSLESEVTCHNLVVAGAIPPWLNGSLLRNGPAHYGAGKKTLKHWFDGQAMIQKFEISGGNVQYSNKFLDTPSKRALVDEGKISFPEFATDPCQSLFGKVFTTFSKKPPTCNAAVNISPIGGAMAGVTETPLPVQFDAETLNTVGVLKYEDRLGGHITSAHPQHRPGTDRLINYLLRFGRKSSYLVYAQAADSLRREVVTRIDIDKPSYMHSFGVTSQYAALVEFPFVVDPLTFIFRRRPFIENYRWRPDRGTRINIIDLDSGNTKLYKSTRPLFAFHHVNAFEDGAFIHMDLAAYDDAAIIDAFYLARLRNGTPLPAPKLVRVTVDLESEAVEQRVLSENAAELPRIDRACSGSPYRYVYGNGITGAGEFLNSLVKIDVQTGAMIRWQEPDAYPGEPVFVSRPARSESAEGEDDGVILTIVLDAAKSSSFLCILDARTLTEIARAYAPHAIPFGFHGGFVKR